MRIISLIVLLLCVSDVSRATTNEDLVQIEKANYTCGADKINNVKFRYCYRNENQTNNRDIVYFFHGLNGDEETWFTQCLGTLMIQKRWDNQGYRPRIVTISFGPKWLLADLKKFQLSSFVSKAVIPALESKMGGLRGGHRHAIGQSMGGFNAAHLALKNPGLFSRVALLCPALATVSPYASPSEVRSYIWRTKAFPFLVRKMINISREVFASTLEWKENDPIWLLKNFKGPKRPEFFVTTGMADSYGFQEGARQFVDLANGKNIFSLWFPVPGPHCMFNRNTTANFIRGD